MAKIELKHPHWERQATESDGAFKAFTTYRDSKERNLSDVARSVKKSLTYIQRLSSDFCWRDRCASYDRYLDAVRLEKIKAGELSLRERHIKISQTMMDLVEQKLQMMKPKDLTARDAKDWMLAASRIQTMASDTKDIARSVMTIEEQETMNHQTMVREARDFTNDVLEKYPDTPIVDVVEVVRQEFGVEPFEYLSTSEMDLLTLEADTVSDNGAELEK
jgi:hypothetical protein